MQQVKQNNRSFLIYLAILSVVGFLATDMYLPTFEAIREDLDTTKAAVAASLSLFLGGYAVGQLFWGPIADRFGKPKALFMGLLLFAITSILVFFTRNITFILILRVIQAFGACATAVCWQALVIDRYPKEQTNRIFATIMPLVALSPALSPLIGVFIAKHFGWRFIFLLIAVICVLLMTYTIGLRKEEKQTFQIQTTRKNPSLTYPVFLKNKTYLGAVLIYAFCSAGFFAWLTGCPFFLKDLGYSEQQIGWSFVPQTIAFMVGGYGLRFFSSKIKEQKALIWLLMVYALSMVVILLFSLILIPTLTLLLIPFCFMAFANGAIYPIVVARALKPFKMDSGKASALQNTIQLGICFLASSIVSLFSAYALMATSIVMAGTILFVFWGYRLTKEVNL